MGFSDFLGDAFNNSFVDKLGETLQDTGWAIGAPVATAFDLARAGFTDDITLGGALATGINRGTQLFLGDSRGTTDEKDDVNNAISPGINKALDGLEWLYDNAIAQPINTLNILQQRAMADISGTEDGKSLLDVGSAWREGDEDNTSIGREWAYSLSAMQDFLPGAWGRDGQFSALTDEGQKQLDEHSKVFDVQSGAIDAIGRFFLDPTIVLGKAAKVLKFQAYIRDIKDPEKITEMLDESSKVGGLFDGFGDRVDAANAFNMGLRPDGAPRTAAEIVAANKGLQDAAGDGWAIAQAMESANKSMRAAGASEDEILQAGRNISLAGIGDAQSLKAIHDSAAEARDALASLKSQRDDYAKAADWATARSRVFVGSKNVPPTLADDIAERGQDWLSSDEFLAMTNERLKAIGPQFSNAQREAARQEKLANLFRGEDSLEGALAARPLLAGARSGTKGMEKRANKESGLHAPARTDFVFQSSAWNKAVKVAVPVSRVVTPHLYYGVKGYQALKRVQAPRTIAFHDENAPMYLNNFLKHAWLDPRIREDLVTQMAGARTEAAKRAVAETAVAHAQESMIRKYAKENPHFSDETAKAVIAEQAKQIAKEASRLGVQTRRFTAHLKDDGTPGDVTMSEDGIAVYRPLLETQLDNQIVLPDLRTFTKILDRHSGWLEDMAQWAQGNDLPDPTRIQKLAERLFGAKMAKGKGFDVRTQKRIQSVRDKEWATTQFMTHALDGLNKMWKYSVLLRPAYPMRVLVDSDLRALSVLGPAAFGMQFAPRAFGFLTMGGASRMKTQFAAKADDTRLTQIKADLEQFEDKWKGSNDGPIVDETYSELVQEAADIEKRLELYRTGGRAGRAEAYGRFGEIGIRDIDTVAGKIKGAFADDYGRSQRNNISSKTTAALMGDSQKVEMGALMSQSWTSLDPSQQGHMDSWLHAVNAQLKQSALGKQALAAQKAAGDNPEAAVRALMTWGRTTQEGRDTLKRMGWTAADREAHAREVVGYVNHYLPTRELREKALTQRINVKDLEGAFPDPLARPPVHGQALGMALGRGNVAGKMLNQWFDRTMKWLSDAPEDQLARHPMYAAVYQQEAKRQAEVLMANPNVKDIGLDEIHARIQKVAHKKAQRAIKTYMFDVAAQSDLSHAMRFVSPFIAAWEDTIKKWGRIAADNPDIVGKGYLVWNAPNDMGMVVDENGKKVDEDDFNDNHFMILQVPSWSPLWANRKITAVDSQFRMPKQAMNIVLQGGLQPGFGPLVAIPVGKLQTAKPEINDVAKFVNPFGPPDSVWDAVAPSTAKRVAELTDKQSKAHMYDTERIFQQMNANHRLDPEKHPAPTWDEAARRANAVGMLKIVNNFANPFPVIFDSPYKLYQDTYRDLQNKERTEDHPRGWADDQFIKAHGETFFPLVQSLSKNYAGVMATAETKNASDRYRKEIAKYGMEAGAPNKALIQMIIGPEGEGEYNQSAHRWQETREISPASGFKYRDSANAQDAAADADADLGWYKFRQFMNQIDAMANDQGFRTYAESEDLVQAKKDFVLQLKAENPSWEVDYDQMDPEKFNRNLEKLDEIANNGTFDVTRTDMAGVRQYLTYRKALLQQLQELEISEGSQDAIPFKIEFTDAVMDLVGSNTKFSEWAFHTFLERDPLLENLVNDPSTGNLSAEDTAIQWGIG